MRNSTYDAEIAGEDGRHMNMYSAQILIYLL